MTNIAMPPRAIRRWTPARFVGTGLMGFWFAAGLSLAYYMIAQYDADLYSRYLERLGYGFAVTVQIVSLSLAFGALISLPIALCRLSKNPVTGLPAYAFVYFFRGTPLIAQTFLVYYGAGQFRTGLGQSIPEQMYFR